MRIPNLVEIEINSTCNLSCSYCPNSVGTRKESGDMDPKLFTLIIDQLKKYQYQGEIAFEFYNEPLLCTHLKSFIIETKKKLPLVTLLLYTNGTKILTAGYFHELNGLGIDKFIITKHEGVSKLPFTAVYEQLSGEDKSSILFQNHTDVKKYNRGGILSHLNNSYPISNLPCSIPSHILTVSVFGNVLSCFEDFNQRLQFGSVKDMNIVEIWNSKPYNTFRENLKSGNRDIYETCSKCNREDKVLENNQNKHLIDELELEAVKKVLQSGKLFRYGQEQGECESFEAEFSEFIGAKHASLVTSGTNALVASLMALGISEGDEVIIPSYTFVATASAVLTVGAIPIVVNIGSDLLITVDEIKKAITDRTKAVIPVHMDGLQCEIDKIAELTNEESIYLIEDVAQALGASYKGKMLGSFGDFGCFSFNRDKTITCGEGGAITTNNQAYHERLLCITDNAYQYNPRHKGKLKSTTPFLGLSMRVSEISGALLRIQLKKASSIIEQSKIRKNILMAIIKKSKYCNKKFNIVEAKDHEGHCFSTIHMQFSSPESATMISKALLSQKVMIIPLTMRLSHFVWKWSNLLKPGATYSAKRDPYLATEKKYNYSKINYLSSIDITMSTLRGDIDITKTEEETQLIGIKIVGAIGDIYES